MEIAGIANAKHEAVAQAFIADRERIGWRAYRAAYPKCVQHTAESAFLALMKKPEFSARIAELEAAAGVAVMTAHEVLVELTKIARADMADYIRAFASGNPVEAMSKLTSAQTAALAEVTVEQFMDGAQMEFFAK
jgi:phage terminase small subunit